MSTEGDKESTEAVTKTEKTMVGFSCVFVDPPPEVLQTECPVCLLVIREPHQVTCCGNSFCHSCVEQVKAASKPCPICNDEKFTDFPDKRLKKTLYSLKVHCTHQKDGCEWMGQLGQLDEHLNTNPEPGKQFDGCQLTQLSCAHCGEKKCRQEMEEHQNEHCTKRPISCEYCTVYKSHHDNVVHNHWPVCRSFPVQCPNDCGSTLQRQNLDRHVTEECPLTTISCDFVGCPVKLPRKDMSEHLRENLLTHISLLAASHTKQQAQIAQLTKENKTLRSELEYLNESHRYQEATVNRVKAQCSELAALNKFLKLETKSLKEANGRVTQELEALFERVRSEVSDVLTRASCPLVPSAVLKMADFQRHRKDRDEWLSPPVYTHHQGYKMRLGVYANGHGAGEGTHVAVIVYLLKGEFDDLLKWPFRGVISFRLLDQQKGEEHKVGSNTYDDKVNDRLCSRVVEGEQRSGLGLNKFIALSKLEPKFLQNDTLLFQIHKVQLH